jgi:hypothetical protein
MPLYCNSNHLHNGKNGEKVYLPFKICFCTKKSKKKPKYFPVLRMIYKKIVFLPYRETHKSE